MLETVLPLPRHNFEQTKNVLGLSLACVLALFIVQIGLADEPKGFLAGFSSAEITPPVGWRRAGGYSEQISTGVNDPLMAKAMILSQGDTAFVLLGNDLCSVPRDLTMEARRRASQATGIPLSNIVVTATHTHGGPEYVGPLRDILHARSMRLHNGLDPHEPIDYAQKLVDTWVQLIEQALANRSPAQLSVVVPHQTGIAFNRRYLMKDGTVGWNPQRMKSNVLRPLGPIDPELPCVLVRDQDSMPIGSLSVFAMHTAVFGGPQFGACYPGFLQSSLRQRLAADDFLSLFAEGCAGDVNQIDITTPRPNSSTEHARIIGLTLAQTIHESLPHARKIETGMLKIESETIYTPVPAVGEDECAAARALIAQENGQNADFLTIVAAWRTLLQHEFWQKYDGELPQEVQAIQLDGDTAIVTLPHEIFVELGITIKAASPYKTTIVISLANDMDFYIPTRRAFEEGNYEPTTCPLVHDCGTRLTDTAIALLHRLKTSEAPDQPSASEH